ncbi:hypothetical protein Scep_023700 [Stephania cephalantha]|uniref:KIB1-4 beta-propeller domain-containing protein n=1 Tax=Stephania cephalantha TaxID=152367 RepID=A0AAP0EV60_9MAGN
MLNVPHDQDHHYCCPIKAIKLIDPVNITSREKPAVNASVYMYYLVEVEGKLGLVIWFSTSDACSGSHFKVFKLDFSKKKWEVARRRDLKGFSLFLSYTYDNVAARVQGRNDIYFKYCEVAEDELYNHKKAHGIEHCGGGGGGNDPQQEKAY